MHDPSDTCRAAELSELIGFVGYEEAEELHDGDLSYDRGNRLGTLPMRNVDSQVSRDARPPRTRRPHAPPARACARATPVPRLPRAHSFASFRRGAGDV